MQGNNDLRIQSLESAEVNECEFEVADTLRENISEGFQSIEAEFDALEEDEARLSRRLHIQQQDNPLGSRTIRGSKTLNNAGYPAQRSHSQYTQQIQPEHLIKQGRPNLFPSSKVVYHQMRPSLIQLQKNNQNENKLYQEQIKEASEQINMFHLKDVILKQNYQDQNEPQYDSSGTTFFTATAINQQIQSAQNANLKAHIQTVTLLQKMDALKKMRRQANQNQFMQAMRSLLISKDFLKIKEQILQREILSIIGASVHYSLQEPLKLMQGEMTKFEYFDSELFDLIQDTIDQLVIARKAQISNPVKQRIEQQVLRSITPIHQIKQPSARRSPEQILSHQNNTGLFKSRPNFYVKQPTSQQMEGGQSQQLKIGVAPKFFI